MNNKKIKYKIKKYKKIKLEKINPRIKLKKKRSRICREYDYGYRKGNRNGNENG